MLIDIERKKNIADYEGPWELRKKGKIVLRIPAISACENKPDGTHISNINEFMKRIYAIGLSDFETLNTIGYAGLSFAGYTVEGGGSLSQLKEKIQKILFPKTEAQFPAYCENHGLDQNNPKVWKRWVNRKVMCSRCGVTSITMEIFL
jgi:hypothetical protein